MKAVPGAGLRRGDLRARVACSTSSPRELELDPLELRRRNHAEHDPSGGRPFSDKNLLECYRRAEPHWERPPRGARPLDRDGQARRRARLADLVGRRRAAELRLAAARLRWARDGRDRGQDVGTGTEDRARPDRGRGARAARSPTSPARSATPSAARTPRSRRAPRRSPRWGRRCAPPPPTRGGRSSSSPRSATTSTPER